MKQCINGAVFKDMIINAATSLEAHKQLINDLNVFPVPDGDTGTNMSMTINSAVSPLEQADLSSVSKLAELTASALLRGARGNSGVILSLLFRGFSKSVRGKDELDAMEFAQAMGEGVEAAYKAVMKPAEGTILTVSRVSAAAAMQSASANTSIEDCLAQTIEAAKTALAETTNQNPTLKKAGVIDAGGKGYLYILESMLAALNGELYDRSAIGTATHDKADFSAFDDADIIFTYCTEFIVSRENKKDPSKLRQFLSELGDSIVVVDDDEIIKVHVHTNSPGVVLTEALTYGSLLTVKIENMREQHSETTILQDSDQPAAPEKEFGVVTVCAGEGLTSVFFDLGVDQIVSGGQTMNPSTDDILKAINRIPAETVLVLPNNKNIIMAAEQCNDLTSKNVVVLPSKTIPQGISAMLVFDASLPLEELTETMSEAISNVHTVHITHAARDSDFDGHTIYEGDYLGLLDNSLLATDKELFSLFEKVADKFQSLNHEFITIYYGGGASEDEASEVLKYFSEQFSDGDISLINGGQPVYNYIISAE